MYASSHIQQAYPRQTKSKAQQPLWRKQISFCCCWELDLSVDCPCWFSLPLAGGWMDGAIDGDTPGLAVGETFGEASLNCLECRKESTPRADTTTQKRYGRATSGTEWSTESLRKLSHIQLTGGIEFTTIVSTKNRVLSTCRTWIQLVIREVNCPTIFHQMTHLYIIKTIMIYSPWLTLCNFMQPSWQTCLLKLKLCPAANDKYGFLLMKNIHINIKSSF